MTRLTALTINNPNNDVRAACVGPDRDGKFSAWVQLWEGWHRMPRPLLSTPHIYDNADAALQAGQGIIDELRSPGALEKILATPETSERSQ